MPRRSARTHRCHCPHHRVGCGTGAAVGTSQFNPSRVFPGSGSSRAIVTVIGSAFVPRAKGKKPGEGSGQSTIMGTSRMTTTTPDHEHGHSHVMDAAWMAVPADAGLAGGSFLRLRRVLRSGDRRGSHGGAGFWSSPSGWHGATLVAAGLAVRFAARLLKTRLCPVASRAVRPPDRGVG